MKRKTRFRVMRDGVTADGVPLAQGHYNGTISWLELHHLGETKRTLGSAQIELSREYFASVGMPLSGEKLSMTVDIRDAFERGDIIEVRTSVL